MRKRKPIGAALASCLWIFGVTLILWVVIMAAATWITGALLDKSLSQENRDAIENLIYSTRVYDWSTGDYEVEQDTKDFWLFEGLRWFGQRDNSIDGGLFYSSYLPAQTACVVYDGDGKLLEKNGNGLYFWYMTGENWHTVESDTYEDGVARALFDQSEISELALDALQRQDIQALRLTGVIEDGILQPSKIECITSREFYDALFRDGRSGRYEMHHFIQEMVESGELEWKTFLASSFEDDREQTYYSVRCHVSIYEQGDPITVEDKTYSDLMDYLEQSSTHQELGVFWGQNSGNLWDRLICREIEVYRDGDYEQGLEYRILAGVRFSPMKLAVKGLTYVYIGSFVLFALAAYILWSCIRSRLIAPLQAFHEAVEKGWGSMSYPNNDEMQWKEISNLENHYQRYRWERERLQDENARLSKALEYAKEAEGNRRQMTSAVAHELKTPLAVIHSYTEGLKDRIAEEKREQYLDVILSETERLDDLVMEMLDLSRLEAGKVKLTRVACNLSEMAVTVLEKFRLQAEEKRINLQVELAEGCNILADESRLLQVMDNLISNAVRYTPEGGTILVKTFEDRRFTWFRVENDSEPFSKEDLIKIWETFYQTDKARSGKGTGLGLPIAKNIIELHGGLCQADNTSSGVAFWFRLQK